MVVLDRSVFADHGELGSLPRVLDLEPTDGPL